ncbi:zinc-dependent alcohol dehydrogenase family protein [Desmospora profundinema]|uniref:NADPH2:quinone reductase n=1 Tax=Desmospora profundinema TaxID=1571184 RepID=A0ABU1IIK9_9BACL|nr:zinc-dependent alcohol dehydrogenase family protein [Desmospora profundinema]MDR6224607.1 NADPH2:quinone reductase [Desmospora profundinema]
MKAQVIHETGNPDVFRRVELPRPETGPGQVLIRNLATSVNPIDCKIRSGAVKGILGDRFPLVLHSDVAGTVEEVGEGVEHVFPGDEVFAYVAAGGALADYVVADASVVAPKPASLTFAEAAALPLVATTAWEALVDRAKIQSGQHVLIHAATGGVGHVAIQLAKAFEARVAATASSEEKLAVARRLGADEQINYRNESVESYMERLTDGTGFDVVFDTVGGENLDRSFQAAKPQGTVAVIAARSTHDLSPLHAKSLTLHVVFIILTQRTAAGRAHHGRIMREISRLADVGKIKPLLDQHRFTFEEAAMAHRRLESGEAVGKIVLENTRIG